MLGQVVNEAHDLRFLLMDVVSTVVVRPCSTHGINRIRKICSFWPRLVARPAAPELQALLNNVDSIGSAIHLLR